MRNTQGKIRRKAYVISQSGKRAVLAIDLTESEAKRAKANDLQLETVKITDKYIVCRKVRA